MKIESSVGKKGEKSANGAARAYEVSSIADGDPLLEWVRLDASHIRKNEACIEKHRASLRALGEPEQRLNELGCWRQSGAFTDREKAALRLSEAVSLPDAEEWSTRAFVDAQIHFSREEILSLTRTVMAVNDWIDLQEKPSIRILVVEDDPYDQELLLHQLKKAHMEDNVLFVSDGIKALEVIQSSRDFPNGGLVSVFLDLHLPGMNGIELLRRIRNLPGLETLPVIVLTSSKNPRDLEECQKLRVMSHIEKPITFDSFSKSIANIFHQSKVANA